MRALVCLSIPSLLPEFSAAENVAMPLIIGGLAVSQAKARAIKILSKVGLLLELSIFQANCLEGEAVCCRCGAQNQPRLRVDG